MKRILFLAAGFFICGWALAELSPTPQTGQTTSYRSGDNGDLETGTEWPTPRFLSIKTGADVTVADTLTGLEWIQEPHSLPGNGSAMDWNSAIDFCNDLAYGGHSDWRLPNIKEMESLIHCGKGAWGTCPYQWLNSSETPFFNVQSSTYLSGTSFPTDTVGAWRVSMGGGEVANYLKTSNGYVWPVRVRQ